MRSHRVALLGAGLLSERKLFTRIFRGSPANRAGLVLGAAFLVVFVVRLPEPLGPDQGLFACFSRGIPRGLLPYRDLFDSKPPLLFYWYALLALIPDQLPRALWWLEGIWLAATLVATSALASRLWGAGAGVAAAALLLLGLWSPGFQGFWSRAQAEVIAVLPLLGSAWLSREALDEERHAFGAGLLVGLASLLKLPALAVAGAWALLFFLHLPSLGAWRRLGWLAAGVFLPWLGTLAVFGARREVDALVTAILLYPIAYARLIDRGFFEVAQGMAIRLMDAAALPLLAGALGLGLLLLRRSRDATWLGAWLLFSLAAIGAQRQLAGYHFFSCVPPLAVAGGYAISTLLSGVQAGARRRLASLSVLVVFACVLMRSAMDWFQAYAPGAQYLSGRLSRAAYLREIQQGDFSPVFEEEAARVVREQTLPGDAILVWAWSPGLYALADRTPATRYVFHKVLLTEAPLSVSVSGLIQRRSELLQRFTQAPPAFVIVGSGDANFFDPVESRRSLAAFSELSERIEKDYVLHRRVGRLTLYRRMHRGGAVVQAQPLNARRSFVRGQQTRADGDAGPRDLEPLRTPTPPPPRAVDSSSQARSRARTEPEDLADLRP